MNESVVCVGVTARIR